MSGLLDLKAQGVEIALIAAHDAARGIGYQGAMPWHIPEDLRRFKALTLGQSVLMGRKTFDSIGKALPKRRNLVLSQNPTFFSAGVERIGTLDELCVEHIEPQSISPNQRTLWIIGGAQLYALALPFADRLELTLINHTFMADAFFPAVDFDKFAAVNDPSVQISSGAGAHPYQFLSYQRKR
jgi:dihydrofolate reductase